MSSSGIKVTIEKGKKILLKTNVPSHLPLCFARPAQGGGSLKAWPSCRGEDPPALTGVDRQICRPFPLHPRGFLTINFSSSYLFIISSVCHLPIYRFNILTFGYFIISSFCHMIISSEHFVISMIFLSSDHFISSGSFYHLIILSYDYFVI